MITRREWLTKNPPPRAGKQIQSLLDGLKEQQKARESMTQLRQSWVTHRDYWKSQSTLPGVAEKARQEIANADTNIAEADKQLANTADVPGRISQLQNELKTAAVCPLHPGEMLYRSMNRAEDMFTCETGPHHLLWTRVNGAPTLLPLTDLALPSLEYPMTDGKDISRAQWLASRPPRPLSCPVHPHEVITRRGDDRIDVFRCKDLPEQILLWEPVGGKLVVWPQGKPLPALEDAIA